MVQMELNFKLKKEGFMNENYFATLEIVHENYPLERTSNQNGDSLIVDILRDEINDLKYHIDKTNRKYRIINTEGNVSEWLSYT